MSRRAAPPGGEAPMAWLWRTSLPVVDVPSACLGLPWYQGRWERALCFRGRKHGAQSEQFRWQTDQRWLNALARSRMVAWRSHTITGAGRADPEVTGAGLVEPREWHTIDPLQYHRPPLQTPPSRREMVRGLAQRGGFFGRTGDGEPGRQAIWQGDQRLPDFI